MSKTKIREMTDGKEYTCSEQDGEMVRCPICNELWMQDIEGDVTQSACTHLRFVFSSEGGFEVHGDWDNKSYIKEFERERDQLVEEDSYDEVILFEKLTSKEIDEIIYRCWDDFPLVQWTVFWGYKNN